MVTGEERRLGSVDIRVEIFVGMDGGTYYEPPEAYLVIRAAEALTSDLSPEAREEASALVEWAADDLDPDSQLVIAVKEALTFTQYETIVPRAVNSQPGG